MCLLYLQAMSPVAPAEQPVLRNTGTCLPRQMCETPGEFLQVERHLEWVTRGHTVWGQTGVFLDREQGHGPNCEEVKLWKKEKGAGLSSCLSTSPRKRRCDMDWTSNVAFYLGSPLLERAPGRSVGVWPTETWDTHKPSTRLSSVHTHNGKRSGECRWPGCLTA